MRIFFNHQKIYFKAKNIPRSGFEPEAPNAIAIGMLTITPSWLAGPKVIFDATKEEFKDYLLQF